MSPSRALPLSSALAFVLPALATLLLRGRMGQATWVHEPLHSSLETAGGLIALAVAAVLLWRRHYQGQAPHLRWVVTALVCMGLQDLAHAWLHVSPGFFWSRALPTLLGGLLMALVWLPARWAQHRAARCLPLVVGLLTVLLGAGFVAFPWAWPNAFSKDGGYLLWARLINMVGGVGFLASAAFFLRRYRREGASEDLVFANHGILFAVAGLLFGVSHLWGSIWWLFHVLRLLAYLVVLHHVVQVYRGLQAAEEAGLVRRLERSEAQMRLVTDALPVLVSFIQPDGRYAYVNRGYTEWFGLAREQVLQRHAREVLGEAAYAAVRPLLERALSGESVTFERAMTYRHGGNRHIRASYMPQRNPQGEVEGVVALVADITAEKHAQERAGRLQAVTSAISRAPTPEDVARAVIAEAIEGIGAGSGTAYAVEPEGGALRLLHTQGLPAQVVRDYEAIPLESPLPMTSVARSGTPLWLESREELLQLFPAMEEALKASANHSWAILPLLGSSGPLGALMIGFAHRRPLQAEERAFLLALSHQVSQAFERANLYLAARAAVRVREDFLSVAGHELRTPLTSLKLQLQLLERSRPTHLGEPRLRAMGRQVERLESLVASLLDVGRLSEGRLSLELGDVELHALTREVLGRLTVRDEGIGIAPEALPRIFGRFERAVSDSQYGGLGLGLYISRQLVEAMGGRLCVESRLEEGSTFTVELPLQPVPATEELAPLPAG